jgi:hypothetical protein
MVYQISNITRSGEKVVLSFPFNQKSKAFMKAFGLIFNSLVVPNNPKPVDIAFSAYNHERWVTGMMWLAKGYLKLWKATDPPFCDPKVRAYQSWGDELIALVNLCEWTLDYVPELSTDSPLEFAGKIILEQKKLDLTRSLYYQGVKGKSDWDKLAAEGLAKLKIWINPYSPVEKPQIFNLISAAIRVAKPDNGYESKRVKKGRRRYYEKAWTPYLNAIRDWNTDARDGVDLGRGQQVKFGTPQIQGDAIVMPSPKKGGKDLVTICKPRKKNLSGRGRKSGTKIKITLVQQSLQRIESEF